MISSKDASLADSVCRYVLGVGCERGAPAEDVIVLARQALSDAGIPTSEVSMLATIDTKTDEAAILALAAELALSLTFFSANRLEEETARLANPSERVFALVGCHGVAESAALAAAGAAAVLVVPKRKSAFATVAVAEVG